MKIEYFARNFTVDDQTRRYVAAKLRKLSKFLDDADQAEARVTLESEKHHFLAEVQVSHRHGTLVAKEAASQVLDAVNLAVDKVETQAERGRKKHKDRRRRAQRQGSDGSHWPLEVIDRDSLAPGSGTRPRVVTTTRLEIKPMSIEEAALELDGAEHEFVVFRDMDTDRISVLYRRRDDNFGLISPEL
jgi:putative sigma-54 modulation protein